MHSIEWRPVEDIRPYERNPRINDKAVGAVASSIDEFGWKQPLVVDSNGVIIVGHTRLKAAIKLGLNEVPVIVADDLDEEQVMAYRLVDNRTAELAEWDKGLLEDELFEIEDLDMSAFGFDEREIFAKEKDGLEEDEAPESPEERCQEGDVWQLGEHRLICGDSQNRKTMERLMDGKEADLLLTDPPLDGPRLKIPLKESLINIDRYTKPGCPFYIWAAHGLILRDVMNAVSDTNFEIKQTLEWIKSKFSLGRSDYHCQHETCLYGWKPGEHYFASSREESTSFDFSKPVESMSKEELVEIAKTMVKEAQTDTLFYDKPNKSKVPMKPVSLFGHLILNSSRPGEIVIDVFAGGGTTVIAAEQTGRIAYMADPDPHHCDIILERYKNLTGNDPELVERTFNEDQ